MKTKAQVCLLILLFTYSIANAQSQSNSEEKDKLSFNIGADLVSRFIWRGIPLSLNANIQPGVSVSHSNLTIGAWGSYSFSSGYNETDMFLSYDLGSFTLGVCDYFNENENDLSSNDFGNFRNSDTINTPHTLEGSLSFNGTENFPLSLTLATFFYGADKDENNKNYFSTYLEAAYTLSVKESEIKIFLGGTPRSGYYSDKAAIVNAGVTASHNLKITDSFSMPVYTSFVVNPDANDVFLVLGLTF
jgi:hypothetical protein